MLKSPHKILFIGDLNEYGRTFQRCRTLEKLGHKVDGLSTAPLPFAPGIDSSAFLEKLMWKLSLPLDLTKANKKIKGKILKNKYDIIWIEKGNTIRPSTLKYIKINAPRAKLISCSEDNMYLKHNRSLYYILGLKYYDLVFTTKVSNISELKLLGAKETAIFLDAYDEEMHRPMKLTDDEWKRFGCDVGFIGTFEENRAAKMLYLAERGIKVVIWGNGWDKWQGKHQNLIIKNSPLYYEYAKAISATKINLCFLRHINQDQATSRSVEIPACAGFMLAERTKKHLELFKEDEEAVFFDSEEELYQKVKKYLANEKERLKIAEAGRRRCVEGGYDNKTQLNKILQKINEE